MRIVELMNKDKKGVYVDSEKFIGVRDWMGATTVSFMGGFSVTTEASPEDVLKALGLEQYVEDPSANLE